MVMTSETSAEGNEVPPPLCSVQHPDVLNVQPRLIADSFVVPAPLRRSARVTK